MKRFIAILLVVLTITAIMIPTASAASNNKTPITVKVGNVTYKVSDVYIGSWYENPVKWALSHNITNGTEMDRTRHIMKFSPDMKLTFEQCIVFLYRVENGRAGTQYPKNSHSYSRAAYGWAYNKGILSTSDKAWRYPTSALTRDDFVSLLYKVENKCHGGAKNGFVDITQYVSGNPGSIWKWAISNGIITGKGETAGLAKQDTLKRSDGLTMIFRFAVAHRYVQMATDQCGKPYVSPGCQPPDSFDCSGLVKYALEQSGVLTNVSPSTSNQWKHPKFVKRCSGDASKLQFGDLIYWSGHVAIYLGKVDQSKSGVSSDFNAVDVGMMHARNRNKGCGISGLYWEGNSNWTAYYVLP